MNAHIYTDSPELLVELRARLHELGLQIEAYFEDDLLTRPTSSLLSSTALIAVTQKKNVASLEAWVVRHATSAAKPLLWVFEAPLIELSIDLGFASYDRAGPLCSALALRILTNTAPWSDASLEQLSEFDRHRLSEGWTMSSQRISKWQWFRADDIRLGLKSASERYVIGSCEDVSAAIVVLQKAQIAQHEWLQSSYAFEPTNDDVRTAVLDVIYGPARRLSDPSSKSALAPYSFPLPEEALCTSATRAANEATHMGYPVRMSIASPDLRVWDHPELQVDPIQSASEAKEAFFSLTQLAHVIAPRARSLGVMVSVSQPAQATLYISVYRTASEFAKVEIGFCDPHGRTSRDRVMGLCSMSNTLWKSILKRLHGYPLLLSPSQDTAEEAVDQLIETLHKLGRFFQDFHKEIARIDIHPLIVTPVGKIEIQNCCVEIGDAFENEISDLLPQRLATG